MKYNHYASSAKARGSTTPHIQRKVNVSKYHPDRACVLCGPHMSHYSVFGDNEREFANTAPDSCICKVHLIEAKRMCGNLDFIPKWKSSDKVNTNMNHRCLFSDCQETDKLISPIFDTKLEIGVSNQLLRIHYCYALSTIQHCIVH